MFTTALVALDQSPAAPATLARLTDLSTWGIKKVILAHVVRVSYNQFAAYDHGENYREWLERCAKPLKKAGLEVTVCVRISGLVADELLAIAGEFDADLLLVGSRAHSRASTLFLGSVARDLIRKTTLSLFLEWVAPDAEDTGTEGAPPVTPALNQVLLATDLSRYASGAENLIRELSTEATRIDLLTVLTPDGLINTPALPVMAAAALNHIRDYLPGKPEQISVLTPKGSPAETIVRIASERDATLIIIGKHGQGWLESKLIGTTATEVCEAAQRPVLIAPLKKGE
ncbi:UspA domain-containing protein [Alcanivorax xiamenensis]|uniref:UspA domain-containing protein n=1 Tax=Alcanivorax xiamenensis TaxID=1177156 RepID=A0ABQ6Y9U6_9GAMM|nr:universal stress protein [Alcanivorax xiamenensis]KAF0806147.1 UspA domain-containing protein [Alcanivorax xiamenensis]